MKKDMLNTVLLICVLVVLIAIAIMMAADSGKEIQVIEAGEHTHSEYVEKTGDSMSGDLTVLNLYSSERINGDGSGLLNLNASRINTGTIGSARLPSDIDATTLDGLDSFDFSLALHNHYADHYTKPESDARYSLVGHTHPQYTDADTLDGYDSLDFALAAHTHSPGDADTLDGYDSTEFSLTIHTHDSRYYQRSEVDTNFLSLGGGTLTGDLYLVDLYASGIIDGNGRGLTNINASAITTGTLAIGRLPPGINADTLDGYDSSIFSMMGHTHDAANIISGELSEARLPQNAIDESEIENGFGLVPSGAILMWNGSSPPSGWALCDGTNGTPDLRGRFIVGYDPSDSDYNVTGNSGGEKSHTLTIGEIPQHGHSYSGTTNPDGGHQHSYEDRYWDDGGGGLNVDENDPMSIDDNSFVYQTKWTSNDGIHTHSYSGATFNTGGGQAHENRPPYYVLAFIMKL